MQGGRTSIQRRGQEEILEGGRDPFEHLRDLLQGFRAVEAPGLPRFWGGLVGYLGYDMVRFIERLPELTPALAMPEARLMLADNLLIFDNLRQTIKVMALVHLDPDLSAISPVRAGGGGHRGADPAAGPTGAAPAKAARPPKDRR